MNKIIRFAWLPLLALAACANGNLVPQGESAAHYGESKRALFQSMVADPEASERNRDPVLGLDGETAAGVRDNYHRNQQAEVQERKLRDQSLIQLQR